MVELFSLNANQRTMGECNTFAYFSMDVNHFQGDYFLLLMSKCG